MCAKNRRKDCPGQAFMDELLPRLDKLQASLEEKPATMTVTAPVGAVVTISMPGPMSAPLTADRATKGFLMLMDLPGDLFHEALRTAERQGLDLVAFNKRVHGVLYHQLNSVRKHRTTRTSASRRG